MISRFLPGILAVIFTWGSCLAQDAPPPAASLKAAERLNRLGLSMLQALHEGRKGNLALSPWPTYRSLALVHLASAGETRKELVEFLKSEEPIEDLQQLLAVIDPQIAKWNTYVRSKGNDGQRLDQIAWANLSAVWTRHDLPVKDAFQAGAHRMPGTVVRGIDFLNPGKALVDINSWVANETEQKIPKLLGPGTFNRGTAFCISSVTYFKAPWSHFKAADTRPANFLIEESNNQAVPTMFGEVTMTSEVYDTYSAIGLPLGNDFQLTILLPKRGIPLGALIKDLDLEKLRRCTKMKRSRDELYLPRFKLAPATLQWHSILPAMGVKSAFARADFSELSDEPIALDGIYDSTEVEVDENGVSSASASVISVTLMRPANSMFRVNRPFFFALQHQHTGACIFLGRVTDPRPRE